MCLGTVNLLGCSLWLSMTVTGNGSVLMAQEIDPWCWLSWWCCRITSCLPSCLIDKTQLFQKKWTAFWLTQPPAQAPPRHPSAEVRVIWPYHPGGGSRFGATKGHSLHPSFTRAPEETKEGLIFGTRNFDNIDGSGWRFSGWWIFRRIQCLPPTWRMGSHDL